MIWTRLHKSFVRFYCDDRGTQLIEFALIFPVLILIFAGTTELGRMFHQYNTLAKATRAGARYLSTVQNVSTSTAAAKNIVMCGNSDGCGGAGQPELIVPGLQASNVVVTPPAAGVAQVKYVKVEISSFTYQPLVFNLSAMTGRNFTVTLTPATQMRYMPN